MKDLHIHIEQGPYEKKWIEKFVDTAVKMNIDEINLLEHSIRIKEFHPTFEEAKNYNLYQKRWFEGKAAQAHSLDEYKSLIDEIRKEKYPVKINFGMEVCWFEQHEVEIRKLLADNYFDIVLGSVHWVDNSTSANINGSHGMRIKFTSGITKCRTRLLRAKFLTLSPIPI